MRKPRSEYPSEQADKFLVRLPDGLRDMLADAAKANGRSMNAEIVMRIQASFLSTDEVRHEVMDAWRDEMRKVMVEQAQEWFSTPYGAQFAIQSELKKVEDWIAAQPDPKPTIHEALKHLIREAVEGRASADATAPSVSPSEPPASKPRRRGSILYDKSDPKSEKSQ